MIKTPLQILATTNSINARNNQQALAIAKINIGNYQSKYR